jgi:hypothetical protein
MRNLTHYATRSASTDCEKSSDKNPEPKEPFAEDDGFSDPGFIPELSVASPITISSKSEDDLAAKSSPITAGNNTVGILHIPYSHLHS